MLLLRNMNKMLLRRFRHVDGMLLMIAPRHYFSLYYAMPRLEARDTDAAKCRHAYAFA